jgi:aspartate/methionine/tyrosine aminotransferase
VGTPVDPTPEAIRAALAAASDAPGYPQTHGTPALRDAVVRWFDRRRAVPGLDPAGVLPTIGSKELVAWLPTLLGLGQGDVVVHPEVAYPTYDVGARLAGAVPLPADGPVPPGLLPADGPVPGELLPGELLPGEPVLGEPPAVPATGRIRLVWVNSPGNPDGSVRSVEQLAEVVAWARSIGAVVASDECYAELPWEVDRVPSVLDPRVCGGSHDGVLAVYSASKQSNLAGYRAAFVAGDPALVLSLLEVRRHAGMMVPRPIQEALRVALDDDDHVTRQRERYRARRVQVIDALRRAGFRIDGSRAGLYLWATREEPAWETVRWLAERGVLVAPGEFYGARGARHVRIALTARDEWISRLAERIC